MQNTDGMQQHYYHCESKVLVSFFYPSQKSFKIKKIKHKIEIKVKNTTFWLPVLGSNVGNPLVTIKNKKQKN